MKNKTLGFWLGLTALVGGIFVFWMSNGIGQMPSSRPAPPEIARPNPLRADHPVAVPGGITQTSLLSEGKQSTPQPLPNFPELSSVPSGPNTPAGPAVSLESGSSALPSAAPAAPVAPSVLAAPAASAPVVPSQPVSAQPVPSPSAGESRFDPFAVADPFGVPMVAFDTPAVPDELRMEPLPEPQSAPQSEPLLPALSNAADSPETELTFALPGMEVASPLPSSPPPSSPSPLSNADPFAALHPEAGVPTHALANVMPNAEPTMQTMQPMQPMEPMEPLRTAAAMPAAPPPSRNEGTGMPGAASLEGLQTPHLALQKVLPEEVVIDQPATLKTVVHNVGNSVAKNVIITDRVPQGTRLLSTVPEAVVAPNGELRWSVGNLDPNIQLAVEMRVLPLREGEIGSVAAVTHTGEASGRIVVTRPMLKVEVNAPAEVRLGETANVEIIISNPGTATVTNVVVEERVPDGLFHRDGRVMRHDGITVLKPKESKKLTLPLLCTGAGNLVNHVVVTADGNLMAEDRTTIRALAPVLELEIVGARSRFLERRSDYRLIVSNKGNAAAHNVALELKLPIAMQFVSTNQSGVYEASTHSVHWALEELPAQEAGEIELLVLPTQTGEHSLRFSGLGANNLRAEASLPVSIDGIPAITFDIVGDSNLVELGKDVVYEIRVVNRGTKAAENVRVQVALAEGMTFVKAEGGRSQAMQGGIVQFEVIPQLAAKEETVYKLTARSQVEGDHRINVRVVSDDLRSPITKEESTRVFR